MKRSLQDAAAVVFDDHKIFAESFSTAIQSLDLFRTVHAFTTESELKNYFVEYSNNQTVYLFLDYYLSEKNGLSVIKEVRWLNRKVKILVVSSITNSALIGDIMMYRPNAFLSKNSGMEEVITALQNVIKNKIYTSPFIQQIIDNSESIVSGFTERELELLQYFAKGYSSESTAKALALSIHTVIAHRRRMMGRIQCHSIVELLAYARNANLI